MTNRTTFFMFVSNNVRFINKVRMGHLERRQRDKEETKQKLLQAAREIAIQEGWHSVTIRKIADKVEYTPPIVYEYFENKDDLFRELIYTGFEILQKEFEAASQEETDPKKLLLRLALINWKFVHENPDLFQLMFNLERPKVPNEAMIYIMTLLEQTIRQISNGDVELVRELVLNFLCLSHGAISVMLQFNSRPPEKRPPVFEKNHPKALFVRMIERFINSL